MVTYTYTAKHLQTGEMVKAEVSAENELAAAKLLNSQQLFPISIEPKSEAGLAKLSFLNSVGAKDRVIFSRQLSTLINAGLPLLQSLRTVQDQISSKPLQEIVKQVSSSVEGGSSLSAAFGMHPKVFNQIYVSLVAAGESSGTLDETLERLADQQEKDADIVSKIRGAMVYPFIVVLVIIGVLIFMLTTVLPQVGSLYKDLHKQLPFLTRMLLAISQFIMHDWWLAIILLGLGGYGANLFFKTDRGRTLTDTAKIKTPILGRMFMKVYMARLTRTLGTLLQSGIPMLQALAVVKNAINNTLVANSLSRAMNEIKGGKALSTSLEGDPRFLVLVPQMIKIGEQSGAIDDMLNKVASFYEKEVDQEVKNLSATLEPVMMIVLGLTVGLVIAAILLPVYSLVGSGGVSNLK